MTSGSARSRSERRSWFAQPMPGLGLAISRISGRMSRSPLATELAVVALGGGGVDVEGQDALAGIGRDAAVAAGVGAQVPGARPAHLSDELADERAPWRRSRGRCSSCCPRSRTTRCRPASSDSPATVLRRFPMSAISRVRLIARALGGLALVVVRGVADLRVGVQVEVRERGRS